MSPTSPKHAPREWTLKVDDEYQYLDGVRAYGLVVARGADLDEGKLVTVVEKCAVDELLSQRNNLSFLITDLFEALTPPKSGCDCDDSIDQGPQPCVFHRFEREMRRAMAYTDKPTGGAA